MYGQDQEQLLHQFPTAESDVGGNGLFPAVPMAMVIGVLRVVQLLVSSHSGFL
jgi:serine phosphatase RsbU (regulator of sigma subunit)